MLLDTHCPDTITTIQQIQPTQNLDSYLPGFLPLQLGDQLTTFEEYRGFYCRGVHTRTSPWQRDFFIYSDLDSSALNTGIGYADQIGPGLGHWIDFNEMQSYSPPYPNHPLAVEARSINWYNDRIDSSTLCPCAILLKNPFFYPSKDSLTLGRTWFYGDSAEYYHVPNNTTMGYIWPKRIRYQTPPRYDTTSVDLPVDSLWQNYVSGHEIGHMINMPHSSSDSSIMGTHIANPYNPPHVYEQADLDYFLVKPPQP